MKEKRRFIRFDIALRVNYIVQAKKETRLMKTGVTKNISAEGMQLLTEEKLEVGNKLEIKILVPEALNPVHLKGRVLWTKEAPSEKEHSYNSGIEFAEIEEDNKNTFLKFLCDLMYGTMGKMKA